MDGIDEIRSVVACTVDGAGVGAGGGGDRAALNVGDAVALCTRVVDAVGAAVVGKQDQVRLVLCGILAGAHVLIEDNPGLGKTLLARSFAQVLGLEFRRVQFTPDLLPADVTGSFVYDQRRAEFEFRPGPVFAGLLLADEINRTPPKTQAALLEAMQERQVTVEGRTFPLPDPFCVIATANPIEFEGTYQLPEAQLDRFMLRVGLGYPSEAEEVDVLQRRVARRHEAMTLPALTDAAGVLALQQVVESITVESSVAGYCVQLAAATRTHQQVLVGASPRGSLALLLLARAYALVDGRDFVTPEDVKAVGVPALAHRITLQPELWLRGVSAGGLVQAMLDAVPTPAPADRRLGP